MITKSDNKSLPRSISLMGATMLVVGNVVGAGIFTTSGTLAAQLGNPISFILVWIIGGLLTIIGALTYAELGAMFPRAGGDYQFLKEAYGPLAGFILGWLSFWVIGPGSIAALSLALAGYLPGVSSSSGIGQKAFAMAVVVSLSALNFRSTKLASRTQSIVTIGSLLLLMGLIIGGALVGNGDLSNFKPAQSAPSMFSISGTVMISVFFTYSGWFAAAYVGSEVKNPGRNVPLALIGGTLMVMVLYSFINAIYLYAMPLNELAIYKDSANVAQAVSEKLFGGEVAFFISAAIVLAIASCINATVMTSARICYAMAEDEVFPKTLGAIHGRYQTPSVAIIVQAVLAIIIVALSSFGDIIVFVVFAMLLSSMAVGVAHIVLRIKRPELERPYKTIGYPFVPIVFALAYGGFAASIAYHSINNHDFTPLIGLGIAFTGVPAFFIWRAVKKD